MAIHHYHMHMLEILLDSSRIYFLPANALSIVDSAVAPTKIAVIEATIIKYLTFILLNIVTSILLICI